MKSLSASQIRQKWIEFFQRNGHTFLKSASLVPKNDKSLLFINSGVATLKAYFEGRENPPSSSLVNSQKAIRTNDIENVGFTSRHHTFFEMLGNFSIGGYFKKEAIKFAFDFLTGDLEMEKEKLFITVLDEDQDTIDTWLSLGIEEHQIIMNDKSKNFWEIGMGPCGPCTEIFYDRGSKYDPLNQGIYLLKHDIENDRYIEIWNIVFSQFNNLGNGEYKTLARKNIDTGAGLERIASVMQLKPTNFETDLFLPLIKETEKYTSKKYIESAYFQRKAREQKAINCAFKVIADHVRAVVFAISDGVEPSNKEAGYIVRRLIRRAVSFAKRLEIQENFLDNVARVVVQNMSDFYPDIKTNEERVIRIIKLEEEKFNDSLKDGLILVDRILEKNNNFISAENTFKLYESHGLPIEFLEEYVQFKKGTIDTSDFEQRLEKHQMLSKFGTTEVSTDSIATSTENKAISIQEDVWLNLQTESKFVGYETTTTKSKVVSLFDENKEPIKKALKGKEVYFVLDKTPFYATTGGQVADTGSIRNSLNIISVLDVFKGPNGQHIHKAEVIAGDITLNDYYEAEVTKSKRIKTEKNHSATHLIHSGLIKTFDDELRQSGSLVDEHKLRFDFKTTKDIKLDDLYRAEDWVNEIINKEVPGVVIETTLEEAKKAGAIALFEHKYKEKVRMLSYGKYSIELCGGTHVENTKEVEEFMIVSFESKGLYLFRIEALTSHESINEYMTKFTSQYRSKLESLYDLAQELSKDDKGQKDKFLEKIKKALKILSHPEHTFMFVKTIQKLEDDIQNDLKQIKIRSQNEHLESVSKELKKDIQNNVRSINGLNVIAQIIENVSVEALKKIGDSLKSENEKLVTILVSKQEDKSVIVIFSQGYEQESAHANVILTKILKETDGRGGGKPSYAQGQTSKTNDLIKLFDNLEVVLG